MKTTIKIPLSLIHHISERRPPAYLEEVLAGGIVDQATLTIDSNLYLSIIQKWGAGQRIASGTKEWPIWAKTLKLLSKPEDKGLGDVLHRTIGDENSTAFKTWFKATFGKDCGCTGRQRQWNLIYPLT